MQHRPFGSLDFQASALGFGCMRLPILGDPSQVDEPEAIRMIRYAVDRGVNYVDTAYGYHFGNSERVLGKALQDGYRQRVRLATKLFVRGVREYADLDRQLNEQLARLMTDHIDCYLLHGLDRGLWSAVHRFDVIPWAERAMRDGRIGRLGFSFHDDYKLFREIVDGYDGWALCQVQFNYLDEHYQAGIAGVRYAASKGLAVVVMEPLLGGRLADPPKPVLDYWAGLPRKRTPTEWALRWVWQHPEVSVALSGMTAMEHVVENVSLAEAAAPPTLTPSELEFFPPAREIYSSLQPIRCTECRYCAPCPHGVEIPENIALFNRAISAGTFIVSRWGYQDHVAHGTGASACLECGECESRCPQHIPVAKWMTIIDNVLGKKARYDPTQAPS